MTVKSLHASENFPVVATVYEDLGVAFDRLCQKGKGTLVEDLLIGLVLLCFNHFYYLKL